MQTFIFRVEFNPLTLHIPSTVSDTECLGKLTGEVETFHPDGVRNGRSGASHLGMGIHYLHQTHPLSLRRESKAG